MSIVRKRSSLSKAGREFLTSEYKAITRTSPSSFRRRCDHMAVTFRPRKKGRDAIPDCPMPIDEVRLIAVSYRRRDDPQRGLPWEVALGIYQPALDFAASGRVVFRCRRACDATNPYPLIRPRPDYPTARSAVVLHQAIQDAEASDLANSLCLPRFLFGFEADTSPQFDPRVLPIARDAERFIDGLRSWPAEFFIRDGRTTLDRPPSRIFASFDRLKGRQVRNPSYAVLKKHGLLPAGVGYKSWLATVSVATDRGRIFQNPRVEGTEAARIRRAIEDYVLADPAREPVLLADLAEACHDMGIKIADGPAGIDALAALADSPWSRPSIPYAARVQVLRLARSPGRASMSFEDGAGAVDLFDLGTEHDRSWTVKPQDLHH